MQVADIQELIEREPFRPFMVRLNNGAEYTFKSRRDVGAWKDYTTFFYFAEPRGSVRIDTESVTEIVEG